MTNQYAGPNHDASVQAMGAGVLIPELATFELSHQEVDAIRQLREIDSETLFMAHARANEDWRNLHTQIAEQYHSAGEEQQHVLLRQDRFLLNRDAAIVDILLERGLLRWGVDNFELDAAMAEKSVGNPAVDAALQLSEVPAAAGHDIFSVHALGVDIRLEAAVTAAVDWMRQEVDPADNGTLAMKEFLYGQMLVARNSLNWEDIRTMYRRASSILEGEEA